MSDEQSKADKVREELENLNADDLDIEELDDADLEEAAGGGCWDFSCGTYDDSAALQ